MAVGSWLLAVGSGADTPTTHPESDTRHPTPDARPSFWTVSLLSIAGGGLIVLAVPKFDLAPLGWVALVPLMIAVEGARYRRVFWCAWLCGLTTNVLGFYWVTDLLIRFGRLPLGLAIFLHVLLSAYQALAFPIAAMSATWLRRSRVPLASAWVVGFLVADYLFPMVFPWFLGMTQHRFVPFIQIADLVGVVGVTALLVAVNACAYLAIRRIWPVFGGVPAEPPRWSAWSVRVTAAVAVAALLYGAIQILAYRSRRASADAIPVGVVQPSIGIEDKGDPRLRLEHLSRLQRMTAEVERMGAVLAVWPETAYPIALAHESPPPGSPPRRDFGPQTPHRIRRDFRVPLLFGVVTRSAQPRRSYNSAFLLDADGVLHGPVDKNVLLAFGEYIPFREKLTFLERWFPRAGSMAPGAEPGVLVAGNLGLGVLNCYEDILPRYVGRMMREHDPHVLVNITNDAWFGDTAEPHQHFALAVFRTVEQRREMVRAVNTGVSGHVTAAGEVLAYTPTFRPAAFVANVVPYSGRTLYGTLGDWPGYLAVLAVVVLAVVRRRRRRSARDA